MIAEKGTGGGNTRVKHMGEGKGKPLRKQFLNPLLPYGRGTARGSAGSKWEGEPKDKFQPIFKKGSFKGKIKKNVLIPKRGRSKGENSNSSEKRSTRCGEVRNEDYGKYHKKSEKERKTS